MLIKYNCFIGYNKSGYFVYKLCPQFKILTTRLVQYLQSRFICLRIFFRQCSQTNGFIYVVRFRMIMVMREHKIFNVPKIKNNSVIFLRSDVRYERVYNSEKIKIKICLFKILNDNLSAPNILFNDYFFLSRINIESTLHLQFFLFALTLVDNKLLPR